MRKNLPAREGLRVAPQNEPVVRVSEKGAFGFFETGLITF